MKSGKLPSVLQQSDNTQPDPEALHHRNQSSLNRDILRWVFCLQRDDETPPHGIEIVEGIEQEYRDEHDIGEEDGGINKSAVYDRLTDLTHSGLIKKHNSTIDGRRKTYHLTEHGEEVLREYYQTIHTQLGCHFNID